MEGVRILAKSARRVSGERTLRVASRARPRRTPPRRSRRARVASVARARAGSRATRVRGVSPRAHRARVGRLPPPRRDSGSPQEKRARRPAHYHVGARSAWRRRSISWAATPRRWKRRDKRSRPRVRRRRPTSRKNGSRRAASIVGAVAFRAGRDGAHSQGDRCGDRGRPSPARRKTFRAKVARTFGIQGDALRRRSRSISRRRAYDAAIPRAPRRSASRLASSVRDLPKEERARLLRLRARAFARLGRRDEALAELKTARPKAGLRDAPRNRRGSEAHRSRGARDVRRDRAFLDLGARSRKNSRSRSNGTSGRPCDARSARARRREMGPSRAASGRRALPLRHRRAHSAPRSVRRASSVQDEAWRLYPKQTKSPPAKDSISK